MHKPGEVDETEVVKNLLQSSEVFRKFYDNERSRVGAIKWFFDPNLNEKYAALAAHEFYLDRRCHRISLTKFPITVDDEFLIAHEIMHAIFSEEEKSLIIYECRNPILTLSPYLNSMLEDPIVNSLLYEKHNFNPLKEYLRQISCIRARHENLGQPLDPFSRLANAFNLANQIMCWKPINDREMLQIWDDFLIWYGHQRRCPDVVSIGKDLAEIMENIGLTTLDQRKRVFLEVTKNLEVTKKDKLEKYLSLESKFHTNL